MLRWMCLFVVILALLCAVNTTQVVESTALNDSSFSELISEWSSPQPSDLFGRWRRSCSSGRC